MILLSMMDEVYQQPFLNKLSNNLKLFGKYSLVPNRRMEGGGRGAGIVGKGELEK